MNHPDTFSQFGIWSNGVNPTTEQLAKIAEYEDSTSVHIALGKWDYVTGGRAMSDTLTANGIDHVFNEIPGGHDWEFWQLMFAEFAQDHLWAEDDAFDVSATVLPQTQGGKVFLSVSATNNDSVPVKMEITTPFGKKMFGHVKPGKTVSASINTKLDAIPAGDAAVQVTGTVDGQSVSEEKTASYAAFATAP